MRRDFYIYVWFRPSGIPFYVGKGCGARFERGPKHNVYAMRIMNLGGCYVEKFYVDLIEEEAFRLEAELILLYGRVANGGILANATDGGEGGTGIVVSQETKEKTRIRNSIIHKGKTISQEMRQKQSLALKGKPKPEGFGAKISAALTGYKRGPQTEDHKTRSAASRKGILIGRIFSEESKAKMSASAKARCARRKELDS